MTKIPPLKERKRIAAVMRRAAERFTLYSVPLGVCSALGDDELASDIFKNIFKLDALLSGLTNQCYWMKFEGEEYYEAAPRERRCMALLFAAEMVLDGSAFNLDGDE